MDDEDEEKEILKANEEGKILGYRFSNVGILIRAFTRAAYAKEERDRKNPIKEDQDPLATLGDAILKAALADIIFHSGEMTAEQITKGRIEREKNIAIAKVAKGQGLSLLMKLGGSEKKRKLSEEKSILATTIEAVIGALYIDTGCDLAKTKKDISRWFSEAFPVMHPRGRNLKLKRIDRLLRLVLVRHGDIIHPGVAAFDEAVLSEEGKGQMRDLAAH